MIIMSEVCTMCCKADHPSGGSDHINQQFQTAKSAVPTININVDVPASKWIKRNQSNHYFKQRVMLIK